MMDDLHIWKSYLHYFIKRYTECIREINRFLQRNEMRFGNTVQSLLKLNQVQNPTRAHLVRRSQRKRLLRGNTQEIFPRTDRLLKATRKVLATFQWVDFYQSFLNDPLQLQGETREVIAELEAVIARLQRHLKKIDGVLKPYPAPRQHQHKEN